MGRLLRKEDFPETTFKISSTIARCLVKDSIIPAGRSSKLTVTKEMIQFARSARQRFHHHFQSMKEEEENSKNEKQKMTSFMSSEKKRGRLRKTPRP